jgi:hypothetical protein
MTDSHATGSRAAMRKEWVICQRRGHEPIRAGMTIGCRAWQKCKWCGTTYYTTSTHEVVEHEHEF